MTSETPPQSAPQSVPQSVHGDHAFRRFSLALYSADGVEPICLDLQDRVGLDVNLVLLCCWVGRHGVHLSVDALRQAEQSIFPWREAAVEPLRRMRRRLKSAIGGVAPETSSPLREMVKQAELAAELIQQDQLFALIEDLPGTDGRDADRAGIVRGNLLRYAKMRSVAVETLPRDGLEQLIEAAVSVPDR